AHAAQPRTTGRRKGEAAMTFMSAVGTHLWQSTLFAVIVGVATLALKRNHAAIRHALWLAASVKFLVPVAALTALGAAFGPTAPVKIVETEIVLVMNDAGSQLPLVMPFTPVPTAAPLMALLGTIVGIVWLCGVVSVLVAWAARWRRVAAIARAGAAVDGGRSLLGLRKLDAAVWFSRSIMTVWQNQH